MYPSTDGLESLWGTVHLRGTVRGPLAASQGIRQGIEE